MIYLRHSLGRTQAMLLILLLALSPWLDAHAKRYQQGDLYYTQSPVPGWVELDDAPLPPADPDAGGVSYQAIDRHLFFDGKSSQRFRQVALTVNNTAGLNEAAEQQIPFNPAYEQLVLHQFTVTRAGKKLAKLDDARITLAKVEGDYDNLMEHGMAHAAIVLRDIRVGDQLQYSFTVKGQNPVFGEHFAQQIGGAWSVPIGRSNVRVTAPADVQLHHRQQQMPPPKQRRHGKYQTYHWRSSPVAALRYDANTPAWFFDEPMIEISTHEDWRSVAKWGNQLFANTAFKSPALKAKVAHLRSLPTPELQLQQALDYVQHEIRYYGVEVGINSHPTTRTG